MKIIRELSEMILEETDGADTYITCALEYRDEYPKLGDLFYKLSTEEMQHVNALHDMVVFFIENYRKEHGEPPVAMMAVYEYIHKKQIEKAATVKAKQSIYK